MLGPTESSLVMQVVSALAEKENAPEIADLSQYIRPENKSYYFSDLIQPFLSQEENIALIHEEMEKRSSHLGYGLGRALAPFVEWIGGKWSDLMEAASDKIAPLFDFLSVRNDFLKKQRFKLRRI